MSKNINTEKQVKTLVSQRFTSFGGGGKKTPIIGITTISGMLYCENTLLMSDSTAGRFKTTTKCHPELVSGSYQPVDSTHDRSDSEHTRSVKESNAERFRMTTNCHPELVSGSYQTGDSTHDWSDSEPTRLVNNSPVGRFRMTKKVIPRVNEETTCQKKRI